MNIIEEACAEEVIVGSSSSNERKLDRLETKDNVHETRGNNAKIEIEQEFDVRDI